MPEPLPVAVTGSAPGTIDAVLDDYLGKQAAPVVPDTAPAASQGPPGNDAPVAPQSDPVEPAILADAPLPGEAAPPVEPVDAPPADQIVTIFPEGPSGKPVEVTLSELQSSYMRQADYTRKTQEVAQKRQEADQYAQQAAGQRQQYMQGLEYMAQALSQNEPAEPDPAMQEIDPIGFLEQKEARRNYTERMQGLQQEHSTNAQQHEQYMHTQRAEFLNHSRQQLVQVRPDLADNAKMKDFADTNRDYLLRNGFSAQEANSVVDWRHALIVDKARRTDGATQTLAQKTQVAFRSTTPSIRQSQAAPTPANSVTSAVKEAETKLDASGSIDDAVDLILKRRTSG